MSSKKTDVTEENAAEKEETRTLRCNVVVKSDWIWVARLSMSNNKTSHLTSFFKQRGCSNKHADARFRTFKQVNETNFSFEFIPTRCYSFPRKMHFHFSAILIRSCPADKSRDNMSKEIKIYCEREREILKNLEISRRFRVDFEMKVS